MIKDKVIMYESPEAATRKTVTGWVSAGGRFWGQDEDMARFDGATHRLCKNNPGHGAHAIFSNCEICRQLRVQANFDLLPKAPWDGETPLALHDSDIYFFDAESLSDWLVDHGVTPAEVRLVVCEPRYARPIEPDEHYCDDLPEDGDVSPVLRAAFAALNEAIRQEPPLSWWPGKTAATLPKDFLDHSTSTLEDEAA